MQVGQVRDLIRTRLGRRGLDLSSGGRYGPAVDPLDEPQAVALSVADYDRLVNAGVLAGSVEHVGGRVVFGRYAAAFSPAQIRDAARLGIDLRPPGAAPGA